MATLITPEEKRVENRKTLMVLLGVIAFLVVVSLITILVKN
jgi:uncharacterized membrane protein